MKSIFLKLLATVTLMLSLVSFAHAKTDIHTFKSNKSFEDTVSTLVADIQAKGIKIFAVLDQAHEAHVVGQHLAPTTLIIFGNPAAGTPLMVANQQFALDLPLKILVTETKGKVVVSYYDFKDQAKRFKVSLPIVSKIPTLLKALALNATK